VLCTLVLVVAVQAAPGGDAEPAGAAVPANITVDGHGWGHGRGMGQFGALGYAIDHGWTGRQILDHFYGGTLTRQMGSSPDQRVLLTGRDGQDLILFNTAGGMRISADGYAAKRRAVRIQRLGEDRFQVYAGDTCSGPWRKWSRIVTSKGIRAKPAAINSEPGYMLQVCLGRDVGTRYYRGDLIAIHSAGTIRTVNQVDTEALVRSVVAKEVPPSWGDAGDGRGMNALRAQAVAARSYAVAGDSRWGGLATTCDSTSCQVYLGYGFREPFQKAVAKVEDSRTDLATAETTKKIRRHLDGRVARTEFSSSTGGWTAGGVFPARQDLGDATASNPNHDWSVTLDRELLEAAYSFVAGRDLGNVQSVRVATRNGLGSFGGRALTVRAVFEHGDITSTGDDFRRLFGLKSNWFIIRST
jgi:SpoIID/LytB domain protein